MRFNVKASELEKEVNIRTSLETTSCLNLALKAVGFSFNSRTTQQETNCFQGSGA